MLRSPLTVCLLLVSGFVIGQSSGNPFDLTFRSTAPKVETAPEITVAPAILQDEKQQPEVKPDTEPETRIDTSTSPVSSNPFEAGTVPDTSGQAIVSDESSTPTPAVSKPTAARINTSKGFQIFFLLLSFLLLIFIVNVERSFVRDLWRVISNKNYSSLHLRNQRNTMRQILLLMGYSVFFFQSGIFFFNALMILGYAGPVKLTIWIPMLFVLGIYIVRHLMIQYVRWLFNSQKDMNLFGFDISIFNIMVGLILLPLNVLLLFGPESIAKPLILIGITAFILAYLVRQLRWLLTSRKLISESLFLFFIYLCTVEILPLWAISKIFW